MSGRFKRFKERQEKRQQAKKAAREASEARERAKRAKREKVQAESARLKKKREDAAKQVQPVRIARSGEEYSVERLPQICWTIHNLYERNYGAVESANLAEFLLLILELPYLLHNEDPDQAMMPFEHNEIRSCYDKLKDPDDWNWKFPFFKRNTEEHGNQLWGQNS